MIIGVTGYGYSGASAYIDILKEFDGVQYLPDDNEFPILQQTDGILDLREALVEGRRRLNINSAIVRFKKGTKDNRYNKLQRLTNGAYSKISERYLNALIDIEWNGRSSFDPGDIRNHLEQDKVWLLNALIRRFLRVFDKHAIWPLPHKRYFTDVTAERFTTETVKYIEEILLSLGFDLGKDIILDQAFNTINPMIGSEYFRTEVLSIVVDRDPRDIYLLTNVLYPERCSFMPCNGDVEQFVYYYKSLHVGNHSFEPNVLRMNFEDLIYKYESTVSMLEEHLHKSIVHRGRFFQPERSINNVHMFKRFPEYSVECKYIENECSDYLYDFDEAEKDSYIKRIDIKPF